VIFVYLLQPVLTVGWHRLHRVRGDQLTMQAVTDTMHSFDNAWIYDNNTGKKPAFSMWSKNSGIRMDVTTDQVSTLAMET
jgi:hypothetical protein